MRRTIITAFASAILFGCSQPTPALYEAYFEASADDSTERRIVRVIRGCGGEFLSMNWSITDGGKGAFYQISRDQAEVSECVSGSADVMFVDLVERTAEVEKYIEVYSDLGSDGFGGKENSLTPPPAVPPPRPNRR